MRSILLFLVLFSFFGPRKDDATAILRSMYERYHGNWHKTLRFVQQTEKYRNDSLTGTETWYESIVYPKMFRIDFGEPDLGNCVIYRNDSAYIFKGKKLVKSRVDSNELLYLLGGMYFELSFQAMAERLAAMHFNLAKGHDATWKGKAVYVIGASDSNEKVNQIWIEKKTLKFVRFITFDGGNKQDAVFEHHKLISGCWCETLVLFYMDGQLRQKEKYTEIVADDPQNPTMFSLDSPWEKHWHKMKK